MQQAHAQNSISRVTGNSMNAGFSSQEWLNEILSIILLPFTIRSKALLYLIKCRYTFFLDSMEIIWKSKNAVLTSKILAKMDMKLYGNHMEMEKRPSDIKNVS